ncbi:MAG: EAL domain-containing protein [Pseudomonadota bacterium]|nr:EAL domain-containing protein [Pseudomonadota bacterium]
MKTYLRPQSVALIALACGVAATLLAWHLVGRQVQHESRGEFANRAQLAANVVERRIQRYVDLLYGLDALANHEARLSRLEFHRYVSALDLGRRLPGVQAVEFIRRVWDEDRDAFVSGVRADRSTTPDGYPAFDIKPAEGRRSEYWVIDYVEPMAGNEPAFGLDLRTRAGAITAAQRSRDTGQPTMTGRYRLAQETGSSYGLVLYLPVFGPQRSRTIEERRQLLVGFVNVVLRVDDLFAGMMADPVVAGVRIRIHDRGEVGAPKYVASDDTIFYRTPGEARPDHALSFAEWRPRHVQDLPLAGRQWQVELEGDPVVSPWLRRLPLLTLCAGLLVSLLLYGILRAIARTRSEALALAQRATRDLRTQLSFTQQLIEAIPNPVFFKDATGRYLGCNRAFEGYIGVERDQLIGKTVVDIAPTDIADRAEAFDNELLEQPGTQVYESSVVDVRDGTRRDVLFNKATFFDPSGAVAGLVGVIVDITQRKQLEANTRESHERLRAVIHAAPMAIIARDIGTVIRMWNPAAERMFGWTEEEVLNTQTSLVPDSLLEMTTKLRQRAEAGETIVIEDTQRVRRDGHVLDVTLSIAPIHDADGEVRGTMVTIADISRRKQAERALRESESHLRLAMEAAQMGMWYWECETDRFHYSDGLPVLFGMAPDAPPVPYGDMKARLHPEDRELFDATVRHAVKQGGDLQMDYRVVWPDGTVHWVANRAQVHRGADGRAVRMVGVAMDISDRKTAEQRVAHMAHHDALTGLPNRVLLRDRIGQAIAQAHRNTTQLAVLFIDLDRFKTINDSLGHQLGDRLLQSVASRILVCVREGDTVSRVGGDEFVIVIPELESSADASVVAAKILEVLAASFHLHGNDLHVAASIGISLYPGDGGDAETLMRNADTAMYHAKDSGRANFQFFTQHMNVAAQQRLSLENALRRALENAEFEVHYQPLFDLRDRSITGFEALVRWSPPGGPLVMPAEFIAAAEESGLIVPIGEFVLREALRQAKTWQAAGRPLGISVNVSANQLSRSSFVERLRRTLQETGVDPRLVELEVTEGVIIEGASEARQAIDQIAALGVGIAIDDFGTGYSGLAYLKRLPIDTVKIDQSFVRDLTVDPDDAAIVTAIVAMARSLGVDVVAEGVETEEQLAALQRLGCHRGQGYLLARPMTSAAVTRLLQAKLAVVGG